MPTKSRAKKAKKRTPPRRADGRFKKRKYFWGVEVWEAQVSDLRRLRFRPVLEHQ
jgi:hypothetical protein